MKLFTYYLFHYIFIITFYPIKSNQNAINGPNLISYHLLDDKNIAITKNKLYLKSFKINEFEPIDVIIKYKLLPSLLYGVISLYGHSLGISRYNEFNKFSFELNIYKIFFIKIKIYLSLENWDTKIYL